MRRLNAIAAAMTASIGLLGRSGARRRHGVRRRATDRRQRQRRRERHARHRRQQDRPGRAGRCGAGRRHAREPRRQDRDAGDHRHARASEREPRTAGPRPEAAWLLGRQRRHEHGHGQSRTDADAQRGDPRRARFFSAGRGITRKEPMRPTFQIETEEEGRKAVRDNAALERPDHQGLGRRPRRQGSEGHAGRNMPPIIDEAHKAGIRVTAHIFNMDDAQGSDARQPRRLRARRSRQGRRRRDRGDVQGSVRTSCSTRTCRIAA